MNTNAGFIFTVRFNCVDQNIHLNSFWIRLCIHTENICFRAEFMTCANVFKYLYICLFCHMQCRNTVTIVLFNAPCKVRIRNTEMYYIPITMFIYFKCVFI